MSDPDGGGDGRAVVVRWWAGHEIVMNTEGGP